MRIQKTEGIVLAAMPHGEADRMIRIYTREQGKNQFIIKGIRKSRRRPPASTEPGTRLHLTYYEHENRDLHIITDCRILRHRSDLRDSMEKLYHLALLLEATDRTTGSNDPNTTIFEMLAAGTDALSATATPATLSLFYLVHLLRIHGILPSLDVCRHCGRPYTDFTFDDADLRPICVGCARQRGASTALFPEAARDLLKAFLSNRYSAIDRNEYPRETVLNLLFQVILFIEGYYHIEIKSKRHVFSLYRPDVHELDRRP